MSDETTSTTEVQTEGNDTVNTDPVNTDTVNTDTVNTDTVVTNTNSDGGSDSDNTETTNTEETGEGNQTPSETYADFVLPDGVELDSDLLGAATPILKELNATQEQAQRLADAVAKQVQASSESQVDAFNQLMNDWQEKSKNDKEFGGDKFEENVKIARSAIDKFGTSELKQLLEEHGVGNHPEVIRFMVKVGKLTAEDVPGGTVTAVSKAQDHVSLLYPNDRTA